MQQVKTQKPLAIGPGKLSRIQTKKELIQAGAFLFVLSVTAIFLIDGGLQNIIDLPAALDAISRLTSLVGTALLLIMLLLTARIPWIDAQFGQDQATSTHKRLGKPAFYLILTHFLASLASYAITDGRDLLSELWFMMVTFEDLMKATISMGAMVLVVVSSFKFVRKRLRYETWFLTHLLSYLSVLFAIPHILTMGTDLVINQLSNALWVFALIFVAYNIVVFRVISPIWRSLLSGVRVEKVVRESSDSVSIYVRGRKLGRFGAVPGQYFQLRFLTKSLWGQSHPFSISSVPNNNLIRFTIADRGDGSNLMQQLHRGVRVILSGPFGIFTEEHRTRQDVVLIAAGIGIPPVRSLAEGMRSTPGDISILYRTRSSEDAPLLNELEELSELRGHNLRVVEGSRPSNGNWLSHSEISDSQLLQQYFPNLLQADVFVCGPVQFTQAVEKTLEELGLEPSQIHSEEYAW